MNIPDLSKIKKALTSSKAGAGALYLAIATFLLPTDLPQNGETENPKAPIETVIGEEEEVLANGETLITTMKVRRKMEEIPEVVNIGEKTAAAENHIDELRGLISSFLLQAAEKPLQTVAAVLIFLWLRITRSPEDEQKEKIEKSKEKD